MSGMSVATIKSPEFLNINSISPMISTCEIKVLYVGQNRNHSYITKEVAAEMAKSLPGVPIVGVYVQNKEDFLDHGERITIDGEGIKFEDVTKPYGFVAPDAKIWFQEFEDTDEFGNKVLREYLMTTGYLWTGQYEECKRVIDNGNPQSMKLNGETLKGHWSTDTNTGIEFFIINDAMFENLCILGEDVEPCFEGADITAPKLSSNYSEQDFKKSLFTMMEELKFTLSNKEGGTSMQNENLQEEVIVTDAVDETVTDTFEVETDSVEPAPAPAEDEFAKKEDEEPKDEKDEAEPTDKEDEAEPADKKSEDDEDSKKKDVEENKCNEEDKKKYELLEEKYSELETKYNELQVEYSALVEFKNTVEDGKKIDLINSFYMLSEEDKKEVRENRASYSLDDIEAKLAVICVRKKVNFDLEDNDKIENNTEEKVATTFNLNSVEDIAVPAYIQALRNARDAQ